MKHNFEAGITLQSLFVEFGSKIDILYKDSQNLFDIRPTEKCD